jgi:hypothetical protein
MFNIGKTKKTVSFLLVALFVSYYAGLTLFSHTHIISGATIAHSHLHKDSHHDTKTGGHTEQCITFIAKISQFQYIDFLCGYVPTPLQFPLHKSKFVEITHWVASTYLENPSLRAPPVV